MEDHFWNLLMDKHSLFFPIISVNEVYMWFHCLLHHYITTSSFNISLDLCLTVTSIGSLISNRKPVNTGEVTLIDSRGGVPVGHDHMCTLLICCVV